MSSRRGMSRSSHEIGELLEQVTRVVRTGTRFRVVLHAERPQVGRGNAFDVAVVEVDVRDLDAVRQRVAVDRVVVVLARDLDAARRQMAHRMVAAVMPEPELERAPTE